MALTKVSGEVIQGTINVGVITATKIDGNVSGNINSTGVSTFSTLNVGNIIASSATISGNVSVAGTVTYEDVTNVDSIGLGTFRNGLVVNAGTATTALIVSGNTRITGILTIGTSSITLDGSNNQVNVGTGVTLHHSNGVQVGGNNLHSTGLFLNALNVGTGGTIITSTSGGNVGVGTTVPRAKLDIGGGSAYNTGTYQSPLVSVSGGYLSIKSQNADGVSRLTLIGDSATGDGTIDWGGNGNFNLKFTNNGSERARFDSSGRFGIGTNNPQYPLDVNGNIRSTNQIYSTVAQGTAPFVVSSTTRVDNLNANLLGGYAGDQYFGFNYTTITVGGNASTWYPVLFRRHAFPTTYYIRKYVHDYQSWDGVLSFVYMCHTGSWGGDAGWDKIIYHAYSSRQFIGAISGTGQSNSYTILYLLGGGRNYQCSTQPFVGEYPTVYLNGGTVEGTALNSISSAQTVATGWEP